MIQVGKHSNLFISSVSTSENADLMIQFKQASVAKSRLASMSTASVDSSKQGQTQDFKLFALKTTDWQGASLSADDTWKAVQERQDQLTFIMSQYMTLDKIDWLPVYKATGFTDANMDTEILKKDAVAKLNDGINAYFMKQMKPFVKEDGKKFYCVFVRSSAKSHFPKLRTKFLGDQPFMVPMDQPELFAKADYTKYELGYRKGDADGQPSGADLSNPEKLEAAPITGEQSAEQLAAVNDIFGDSSTDESSDELPF